MPWLLVACVAKVLIFSLYSWAARLLYLALAALVVQLCWLKNATCRGKVTGDKEKSKQESDSVIMCLSHDAVLADRWCWWRRDFALEKQLTALALPPTCIHLRWNQDQLKSSSVDLRRIEEENKINKDRLSVYGWTLRPLGLPWLSYFTGIGSETQRENKNN